MKEIKNIDTVMEEIQNDIESMNNMDIRMNVVKYNTNAKKIKDCRDILKEAETLCLIDAPDETSEELISDSTYNEYNDKLETIKKSMNVNLKLADAIKMYRESMHMINMCKAYLENQKIEISNID